MGDADDSVCVSFDVGHGCNVVIMPACSLSACPAHQLALCSLLVALNYAEFNQLTLIGAPQSGECQVELTQSHQSCAGVVWPGNKSNLDDVYGAADDGESSTICPLCLSPSLSTTFSPSSSLFPAVFLVGY